MQIAHTVEVDLSHREAIDAVSTDGSDSPAPLAQLHLAMAWHAETASDGAIR